MYQFYRKACLADFEGPLRILSVTSCFLWDFPISCFQSLVQKIFLSLLDYLGIFVRNYGSILAVFVLNYTSIFILLLMSPCNCYFIFIISLKIRVKVFQICSFFSKCCFSLSLPFNINFRINLSALHKTLLR